VQDWSIPLVLAAAAFLVAVLWRFRPAIGLGREGGASKEARREALGRVEAARNDAERALLLCEAAAQLGTAGALGMYQRALRADPASADVVARVVAGMSHRPRRLESLLWRHLSSASWTETREATRAVLDALRALYDGPLKNAVRAKAMANARDSLG
jgi:hypothetical protein